jgi:hypothetical protein
MKTSILILALVVISISSRGQFMFDKVHISKVRTFEDSLKSESKGFVETNVSSDFFKGAKAKEKYYPLVFKRNDDSFFPNCNVEYYYNKKDSIIHMILMDWNIMNYITNLKTQGDTMVAQVSRKNEYVQKYNQLKTELIKLLGAPTKVEKISEENNLCYGEAIWNLGDKNVNLSLSFTPELQEVGEFKFGTFRIRLKCDLNI